eukprot:COSAG04_NODE_7466_length_1123_cov_4.503906_1_plen_90_part_10
MQKLGESETLILALCGPVLQCWRPPNSAGVLSRRPTVMGGGSTHSSDRQLGNPGGQATADPQSPPAELQPCPQRPPPPTLRSVGGHSGGQ